MKNGPRLVFSVVVTMFFEMSLKASAQAACAPPWKIGIPITTGQILSFGGHNWKAIQPETQTVDGWQPPNVPALWSDLGPCSGGGGTPTPTPTPAPTPTPSPTPTPTPGGGGSCNPDWTAATTSPATG